MFTPASTFAVGAVPPVNTPAFGTVDSTGTHEPSADPEPRPAPSPAAPTQSS